MKDKPEKPPIEVVARKNSAGTFDVVTAFLGNTVGDTLGRSTGLEEDEAKSLAKQWMDRQRRIDKAEEKRKETKTNPNLRQWD